MSTRKPKSRGPKNRYPPRIDATPEDLATLIFQGPMERGKTQDVYTCGNCGRGVFYPEVLYDDGLCEQCHKVEG